MVVEGEDDAAALGSENALREKGRVAAPLKPDKRRGGGGEAQNTREEGGGPLKNKNGTGGAARPCSAQGGGGSHTGRLK